MTGMKLQSLFRRKEKLSNQLVINAEAHQGPAGTAHAATLAADVRATAAADLQKGKKKNKNKQTTTKKTEERKYLDCAVEISGAP